MRIGGTQSSEMSVVKPSTVRSRELGQEVADHEPVGPVIDEKLEPGPLSRPEAAKVRGVDRVLGPDKGVDDRGRDDRHRVAQAGDRAYATPQGRLMVKTVPSRNPRTPAPEAWLAATQMRA
jgi:hypothetical protein